MADNNNQAMEVESVSTVDTFPMDYDCAFELFERVGFEECMSLAEAYIELRPIANRMYKRKFNKLAFDFQQPIDRPLRHAGPTAKSLILTLNGANFKTRDLIKIRRKCKQLRCLTLNGFDMKNFRCNPFINFGNRQLEELTLNKCSLAYDVNFFDGYKELKSFNMFDCNEMHFAAIDSCFKNNPGINSFTCNDQYFQIPQLLMLLPNLERLSLRYHRRYMTLDMLSVLPSLRYLTLICSGSNANDVLAELGKSNRLEELVLVDVHITQLTFPLIKSLQNLKLLAITSSKGCPFPASKDLPTNLTKLKLEGFRIDNGNIAPVVGRLPHLGNMLLKGCELPHDEFWVSDFDWMSDLIIEDLTDRHAHRRLNVAVEAKYDQSPKVSNFKEENKMNVEKLAQFSNSNRLLSLQTFKSVGHVRITNYVDERNLFDILYPGMDGLLPATKH